MNAYRIISLLAEKNIFIHTVGGSLKTKAEKGALTEDLVELIKLNKDALVKFLTQAQANESRNASKIPVIDRDQDIPCSFAQQRLWFIDKMQNGSTIYNVPVALKVEGSLDVIATEQALKLIVERHEILRTTYKETDDGVVQVINSDIVCPFAIIDLNHINAEDQATEVERLVQDDLNRRFDLSKDVMLRASCIALNSEQYVLLFNMHHIASDGWSMGVMVREFMQLYQALSSKELISLSPLQIQYADFAAWQRANLNGEFLQQQLEYWQQQLADIPAIHGLPLDFKRPETPEHKGAMVTGTLPGRIGAQTIALARRQGVTPFMLIHAVLSLVLSRHSYSTDVVLGTPVANRHQPELEPLIGFFVNNLVLRSNSEGCESFTDYLAHIKEVNFSAQANQDVPFEQVVEHLNVPRQRNHTPLFQIMFTMNTNVPLNLNLDNVSISQFENEHLSAKFDLLVDATVSDEQVQINWLYDKALFKEDTVERLSQHLLTLLETIVSAPDAKLSELLMLSNAEADYLFNQLDTAGRDYPKTKSIHQLFSEQVLRTPKHEAVRYNGVAYNYEELNHSANRLARYMLAQGVSPNDFIGIAVDRSFDMIVGILAILKVGGVYVPLDPGYPDTRLEYMLADCQIKTLLTQRHLTDRFQNVAVDCLVLDEIEHLYSSLPNDNLDMSFQASDLAYVNYTSGSMGKPKGVMVRHLGVVRLVSNPGFIELNEQTRFLQAASISFDAATLEIWAPLLNGGCVVLYPDEKVEPLKINQVIQENAVTDIWLTAGLFEQWSEYARDMPSLIHIIAGGDVVSPAAVRQVQESLEGARVVNGYGPTENTTFTCCYSVPRPNNPDRALPLGRPINGTQAYVLAKDGTPAPFGCVGELCIGGDGLAAGYLNNTTLTQDKFIQNPFAAGVLYRTGDLVQYLETGDLAYHGRTDNQVKVRGFRVELAEIELVIKSIDEVREAAVIVKEFMENDKRLVGYIVCSDMAHDCQDMSELAVDERKAVTERLRNHLVHLLPDYMVPSVFVLLKELPLTSSGKVNRKTLPEADFSQMLVTYVAPTVESEIQLCEIWQKLLGVERVGSADNFFHLGGHSLLVVKLVKEIEELFGVQVAITEVFDCPDLKSLAAYIDILGTDNSMETFQDEGKKEELEIFHL
ncbi:non-ribosomal peptide synthetase [Pseudoalteromonas prydzensis]|uniref:non-ribosomal peptide synthetase n=1 Tax=Pseudoalteromonas prydzensis TaxID=182141 RepID=UPI0007E52305|nr:non-ribosomal peptide synthetase [Pseudoalteromonas prydzensis]MBE0377186.1 hypothetical protein [Pseudoalteromonas prydzensis ACAM 620]